MPVITKPNQHFDATLYTGNGTGQSITNSGSMQPDFVWVKSRTQATSNYVYDSIRGAGNRMATNLTVVEASISGVTSFDSTGFTLGTETGNNNNADNYVAWQWKAASSNTTNTDGSITSTIRVNQTAGFSIVTYTGNGTGGATVGHGLGVAPSMVIVKRRNGVASWIVNHTSAGTGFLLLENTAAYSSATTYWTTAPTSSLLPTLTSNSEVNSSGGTYVAYCFAQVAGYSAFGSYTGNGSSNGPFIYTGFRPRYIMRKRTDTTAYWIVYDTARNTYNLVGEDLYPNDSLAGSNDSTMDILSNGFKIRGTGANLNANGGTYIYAAFAEAPFKYANAR